MILLRISLRILIGFYKDFTNFYGFVKKMVQKNQYTYNVPPGPSDYIYNEARRAELTGGMEGMDGMDRWTGYQKCPTIFFILFGCIEHVCMYYSREVSLFLK